MKITATKQTQQTINALHNLTKRRVSKSDIATALLEYAAQDFGYRVEKNFREQGEALFELFNSLPKNINRAAA